MSGGIAVKDGAPGGVSPGLHKRSAEGWGDRVRSRQGILDGVGAARPEFFGEDEERSDAVPRVRDTEGASAVPERGPERTAESGRSPALKGHARTVKHRPSPLSVSFIAITRRFV